MIIYNGKKIAVKVVGSGASVQLFAPTIDVSSNTLIITDGNGDFAEHYEIYANGSLIANAEAHTVDLAEYIQEEGVYEIKVKAISGVMITSEFSNTISFNRKFATEGLAYTLSSDGTYYSCSGIGTVTDTDIVIASEHEGLPVTRIAEQAFRFNRTITSMIIPDSVTHIGGLSLHDVEGGIQHITIGSGVVEIGNWFLALSLEKNPDILETLTIKAIKPPTIIAIDTFLKNRGDMVIYVPAESVEAYKAAEGWSAHADKIFAITE